MDAAIVAMIDAGLDLARRHLRLSTAELLPEGQSRVYGEFFASTTAAIVSAILTYAAVCVVLAERERGFKLSFGLPVWLSESVMPLGLGLMAVTYVWRASPRWVGRVLAFAAVGAFFALGVTSPSSPVVWALSAALLAATLLGSPVFAAMAGFGVLFFWREGVPVSAVTAEIYRLIASPTLPAIPLLTACGFVLAETQAAQRLVRFFRAWFGFLPGGVAILVAAVCTMFTAFTGTTKPAWDIRNRRYCCSAIFPPSAR